MAQSGFKRQQGASLEQHRVISHFAHQPLLCRNCNHLAQANAKYFGGRGPLAFNLAVHLRRGTQVIPKRVNLVQHHQSCVIRLSVGDQMFPPD